MKKITVRTLSIAASLVAAAAVSGTSSAYAAADKDISALDLSVILKSNVFTYTGNPVCPEYMLTNGATGWTSGEYKCADYTIDYRYNIDAGTGSVVAVGTGDYSGQQTLATFTINPMNVTDIPDFKLSVEAAQYTGKPVLPDVEIASGYRTLRESVDYTVSALNNIDVGYGVSSVKFKGNYTGDYLTCFRIDYAPIIHLTGSQEGAGNVLKWDKVECDEISVYRYDEKSNSDILLGTADGNEFIDTAAPQFSDCRYTVKTRYTYNGKEYYSTSKPCTVSTTLNAPKLDVVLENGTAELSWNSNPDADGYFVYMDGVSVATVSDRSTVSYTINDIDPSDKHTFSVASFALHDGQFVVSPQSEQKALGQDPATEPATDPVQEQSVLANAKKGDRRSFKIINSQKQTDSLYATVTLTDNDFAILEKFAKEHFNDNMTDTDKLIYTLEWINRNTKYASTSADWSRINGKSYVEAIFNLKTGQCLQYNGAMVSMMRYLGYEANMVLGWRGTWPSNYWQHFWGEIEIDGTKYMIETGNYGKSGGWGFFLAPYNYTDGKYIINCKNMQADFGGWWYY